MQPGWPPSRQRKATPPRANAPTTHQEPAATVRQQARRGGGRRERGAGGQEEEGRGRERGGGGGPGGAADGARQFIARSGAIGRRARAGSGAGGARLDFRVPDGFTWEVGSPEVRTPEEGGEGGKKGLPGIDFSSRLVCSNFELNFFTCLGNLGVFNKIGAQGPTLPRRAGRPVAGAPPSPTPPDGGDAAPLALR